MARPEDELSAARKDESGVCGHDVPLVAGNRDMTFVSEPRAIPPAVGCRSCGRWHYPERVEVRDIPRSDDTVEAGVVLLNLVCSRCHAKGFLRAAERCDEATTRLLDALLQRATGSSGEAAPEFENDRVWA